MKKIAVVLPGFDVGGTENMVANLVCNLNRKKYEVMVISLKAPTNSYIQKRIEDSGIRVEYCNKKPGGDISVWFKMTKLLRQFKPDLIHSNMYPFLYTMPYLLTHRIHLVHTIHNKPVKEFKDKYKKVIRWLYKCGKATPVAISDIIKDEMLEIYPLKTIECIYNPVEVEKFRNDRRYDGENTVFINVARMMLQKNQSLLLDAFKYAADKDPKIKLVFAGDGELRPELESKVKKLGLEEKVVFLGSVSNVPDHLAASDVFILSSDYEGLPLSALEAMASGLPVISTEVGGMADIVTDNGILVKKGDYEALGKAMLELSQNRELREEYSRRSFENVKKYDVAHFTEKYEKVYEKYCR